MTTQIFLRCSLGLALSMSVFSQPKPPVTGGGSGGGGGATPTRPGTAPSGTTAPFPSTSNSTAGQDTIQRPNYISGRVVMEDGTPPDEPIPIQLVCRSSPHNVGYTDPKGTFGVDLNNKMNRTMYADASDTSSAYNPSGGTSSNSSGFGGSQGTFSGQYMGCDVQAQLAGFRSDIIHLDARRSLDNPEIGTIILHRLGNVEGLTISATSQMAPKDAKKAYEKGFTAVQKNKSDEAEKEFQKAVAIYPKFAAAWFQLGLTQEDRKDPEGARKSFAQALAADSKYVNPYLELGLMAVREQKWQEAADQSDKLLRLNPVDFPRAWMVNALANYYLKNMDAAEKSAREGISRDTIHKYPVLHRILASIVAQKQDYTAAAQNLRDYLRLAPGASDAEDVKKQLAEVEKISGPQTKKQ
jgi:tetratricopeptide (TPR) repeat protein